MDPDLTTRPRAVGLLATTWLAAWGATLLPADGLAAFPPALVVIGSLVGMLALVRALNRSSS